MGQMPFLIPPAVSKHY